MLTTRGFGPSKSLATAGFGPFIISFGPVSEGLSFGSYAWAASAIGKFTPASEGSGEYFWIASAIGEFAPVGEIASNYIWTANAIGWYFPLALAGGTYCWVAIVIGRSQALAGILALKDTQNGSIFIFDK